MSGKVNSYVHVVDGEGRGHVFGPDDKIPAWAVNLIDNESVWAVKPGAQVEKPAGNASLQEWQEYAASLGGDVEGKSRDELREQYSK